MKNAIRLLFSLLPTLFVLSACSTRPAEKPAPAIHRTAPSTREIVTAIQPAPTASVPVAPASTPALTPPAKPIPATPPTVELKTEKQPDPPAATPEPVQLTPAPAAAPAAAPQKPAPRTEPPTEMTPAQKLLLFARAQLPKQPIRMTGSLKERAPNGFVKKSRVLEIDLDWGADPAGAIYRIRDEKNGSVQTLEIHWLPAGPDFRYMENGAEKLSFNPNAEIDGLGITWADLSFSFLWNRQATIEGPDKKLGRDCIIVSVPREGNHRLLLWIEEKTGRLFGAKELDSNGNLIKEIKVVSVKEFDKIWMVKDLDILRPAENGRTALRIDQVEEIAQ